MARISMAKEILQQAQISAFVGEGVATCVTEHVRVDMPEARTTADLKQ
jgi:hypothetical protein